MPQECTCDPPVVQVLKYRELDEQLQIRVEDPTKLLSGLQKLPSLDDCRIIKPGLDQCFRMFLLIDNRPGA